MKSRLNDKSWILNKPIAHRGLHNADEGGSVGENTLTAYKLAIEGGFPIEMDVQLTRDGVAVCFHDDNLKRVTGVDKYVNDLTYEELLALDVCKTGEKIPTFEQMLKLVNGSVPLMIEIKMQRSKQYDVAKIVVDALTDYKGEFAIQSFDPRIMGKIRKLAPSVLRGQLGGLTSREGLPFFQYVAVKYLILNFYSKPDFINYYLEDMPRKFNRPFIVWTVRTQEQKQRAESYGCNYVFENVHGRK